MLIYGEENGIGFVNIRYGFGSDTMNDDVENKISLRPHLGTPFVKLRAQYYSMTWRIEMTI